MYDQSRKPTGIIKMTIPHKPIKKEAPLSSVSAHGRTKEALAGVLKAVRDEQMNKTTIAFKDLDPAVLAGLQKETGATEEATMRKILGINSTDSLAVALQKVWAQRGRDKQARGGYQQLTKGREKQVADGYKGRKEGALRKKTKAARAARANGTDMKPWEVKRVCKRTGTKVTTDGSPLFHPSTGEYLYMESTSKADRLGGCHHALCALIPDPKAHPHMSILPRKKF